MREKKFTPGPWEASAESLRVEKGHVTLACVTTSLKVSANGAVANANLIAAAPELLGALEVILSDREYLGLGHPDYIHNAEKAIQKAYGE